MGVALLVAASNAASATGGISTYRKPSLGIEFNYPSDWTKPSELSLPGPDTSLFGKKIQNGSEWKLMIDIRKAPSNPSLDAVVNDHIATTETLLSSHNMQIIRLYDNLSIDNNPDIGLLYSYMDNDVRIKKMNEFTLQDGRLYIISYMAKPEQAYPTYLGTMEQVLRSLKLSPPAHCDWSVPGKLLEEWISCFNESISAQPLNASQM